MAAAGLAVDMDGAGAVGVPCAMSMPRHGRGRLDGRHARAFQKAGVEVANDGKVWVSYGATKARASARAYLAQPTVRQGRGGREGSLKIRSDDEELNEACRVLERSFVDRVRRAVDLESLCVTAGSRVWHVEVTLALVADDSGCALTALGIATLVALRAFRRPEVTVDTSGANVTDIEGDGGNEGGTRIVVHDPRDREPVPLSLLAQPLPVQFAMLPVRAAPATRDGDGDGDGGDGDDLVSRLVADPTPLEAAAAAAPLGPDAGAELIFVVDERGQFSRVEKAGDQVRLL